MGQRLNFFDPFSFFFFVFRFANCGWAVTGVVDGADAPLTQLG